jgi:hypothetical protein
VLEDAGQIAVGDDVDEGVLGGLELVEHSPWDGNR